MQNLLRELFGDAVTEESLKRFNEELGKKFVAKTDFNTKIDEIKSLKSDKSALEERITTLTASANSAEDYKSQLENLQREIKEKEDADKAAAEDKVLTEAIEAVFGDKKFTSDYVKNGLVADMKSEIAKPENKGKGYTEIFESLTKDKNGIFANANPPADMTGMGAVSGNTTENAMRAIMGLAPANKE